MLVALMLRWLVVGIGDITRKRVIPAILAEPRSTLYGLFTRDSAKGALYPEAKIFTNFETALADPEIDAVYVASPVSMHALQTIAALRAGKHVLCEKPVAFDLARAEAMAGAAVETGKLLGIAYYRRLFPKLLKLRELLAAGELGQPVYAEANCHGWQSPEDMAAWGRGWLCDAALAGAGPLYDIASHRIDAMNFLFGEPLEAKGMRSNAVHAMGVEDSATVMIRYGGGLHAVVDVRWNSRTNRDQFRVVCTGGEFVLDALSGDLLRVIPSVGAARELHLPTHANVHYPVVHDFVNGVLDGTALNRVKLACNINAAIWTDRVTAQAMT